MVPLGTLALAVTARIAATKRPLRYDDWAVGFDLLVTAVGSQLAALAGANRISPEDRYVEADVDIGFAILPFLLCLVAGVAIWIRWKGTEQSDELKLTEGIFYPILVGLLAIGPVYWFNARLLGAS